ncbi:sterile alpha motif-like domain-containing protein [Staphylococcus hominis]|uniref:sterile alpha motif-like domain-containing protein n=1 Tax=Staphylococcus hominis TaxID=1290 RepID=UPI000E1BD1C6|nr:sterile alpha motif-like domain-containing protein [Staphylococcus hominis]
MSFYDFMQGFIDDKTPLGELASWINQDQDFPKHEYLAENILDYFSKMSMLDHECLEIVKRSLSLYEKR